MTHCKNLHTVISRYQEDLEWMRQLNTSYTIYNKGNTLNNYKSTQLENKGRESDTYLHYITENYSNLPKYIAFLQGNPFPHCEEVVEILNSFEKSQYIDVIPLSNYIATDDRQGSPHHHGLDIGDLSDRIFPDIYYTQFTFSTGAQYIISSECITNKSLEWWKRLHEIHTSHSKSPWIFERLWPLIWKYEEI